MEWQRWGDCDQKAGHYWTGGCGAAPNVAGVIRLSDTYPSNSLWVFGPVEPPRVPARPRSGAEARHWMVRHPGRYLVDPSGIVFFYHASTAWFMRLCDGEQTWCGADTYVAGLVPVNGEPWGDE